MRSAPAANPGRAALLVPCFNARRFLPRLLTQIQRLAPAFDEVILADDASTDGTADTAEAMGFRVVRLARNLGPGGARNALARVAAAEWIHFHDVDDELAPDYRARIGAQGLGECDAVFHWTEFIEETTRSLVVRWQFDLGQLAHNPAATLLAHPMPTMSSLVRRDVFLQLGGFDEAHRCFEDGDFHFRLAASGAKLRCVPEVLEWSLRHNQGAGANQLYCFQCRLEFLQTYAAEQPSRLHPVIAEEAEKTAVMLLRSRDKVGARRAIALAQSLGRSVPATENAVLRMLCHLVPSTSLLRWQDLWRNRHHRA